MELQIFLIDGLIHTPGCETEVNERFCYRSFRSAIPDEVGRVLFTGISPLETRQTELNFIIQGLVDDLVRL